MAGFIALTWVLTVGERALLGLSAGLHGWWVAAGRGLWHAVAPSLVAIVAIYAWMVGRGRWSRAAVGLRGATGPALLRGVAWGTGLAGAVIGLTLLGGARIGTGPVTSGGYLATAATVLLGLAAAALIEELLFRGWPLARCAEAGGRLAATFALTAAFVALHGPNPDVTLLGLVNIGLAGLVLSAVFFVGGGLPAAWMLHLAWNAGLALSADAPVSGLRFALPGVEFLPGRVAWWDGGGFGPEGGLAATVVLGGAAAYWMRRLATGPAEGAMA